MFTIQVLDASGRVKQSASGEARACLVRDQPYAQGDSLLFLTENPYSVLMADQTLPETLVYLPEKRLSYRIPWGEEKTMYAPLAFAGDKHLLTLRPAMGWELHTRRNLAFNPMDQRFYEGCFPHASANVETRDEPQFFARNVIDGVKCSHSHGTWPYCSWGIGGRADAAITLHFGRKVLVDQVGLTLRADFPHDSWWTKGTLVFSDGTQMPLSFEKTGDTQYFTAGEREVEWLRLENLIKAPGFSPYPALTQWEVFGRDL